MTRLSFNRFAILAAVSVLAMAAASPTLAQTPAAPATTNAMAQSAPRADSAAVEGGEVRYFVHGDLNAGQTPVLVLHGAFMSSDSMKPLTDLITDRPRRTPTPMWPVSTDGGESESRPCAPLSAPSTA